MSNFMKASKINLLFSTAKGAVSLHDLWVLPEKTVKSMANKIHNALKATDDLFSEGSAEDALDRLRLDILITVIEEREKGKKMNVEAKERKARIDFLKATIRDKEMSKDKERDISDLKAELAKEIENL